MPQKRAREQAALSNLLGAPTVTLNPIPTLSGIRRRCGYLFKPPVMSKRLVPDAGKKTSFKSFDWTVSAPLALRLVEVLAQIDLSQACFTTGDGCVLRRRLLFQMRSWQRSKRGAIADDAGDLFEKLWDGPRYKLRRKPAEFHFTPGVPRSDSWTSAMQPLFREVASNREAHPLRHSLQRSGRSRAQNKILL